ncbi:MAG: patatin-like phospholipase family protein [Nitrospirae bacterium]|nr:patatin-like phospholipase family protein [Nitrospirota bacterium]
MKKEAKQKKTALILSGGGARGAYEAGIIRFIRQKLPPSVQGHARFDIISGTSVGAIHACFMAATADDPESQGKRLEDVWTSFRFDSVYSFGVGQLWSVLKWNLGRSARETLQKGLLPRRMGGFLNTKPLERVVVKTLPWKNISRNLKSGVLTALSVSATDLQSGHTVVFVEMADPLPAWSMNPYMEVKTSRITPSHALASAAIPLLFPSVLIEGRYYCDGGLRQNTPLSPALRLGADKALIIGLHHQPTKQESTRERPLRITDVPNHPGYLLGKVLNAFLLDHVDYDISRLQLFNALLEGGEKSFGKKFFKMMDQITIPVRGAPFKRVTNLLIRPSDDIGSIAAKYSKRKLTPGMKGLLDWTLRRMMKLGTGRREADLLSYLLFDGDYARELMNLGMKDAEKRKDELIDFFMA